MSNVHVHKLVLSFYFSCQNALFVNEMRGGENIEMREERRERGEMGREGSKAHEAGIQAMGRKRRGEVEREAGKGRGRVGVGGGKGKAWPCQHGRHGSEAGRRGGEVG